MRLIKYIRKNGIKRLFQVLYRYKIDLVLRKVLNIFYKNKELINAIVIESHNDFDCNGGAFYNYLIANDYNKKYKIIWLLKHKSSLELPNNVLTFQLYSPSIRKAYYVCRAKYFTADCVITNKVRSDQKSIYFTHGAIGLKNVAGKIDIPANVDYVLSPSSYFEPILAKQFNMEYPNNKFVRLGYPCHDILLANEGEELKKITTKQYSKVLLWMPTFRKGGGFNRNDSYTEQEFGLPLIENKEQLINLNSMLYDENLLLIIKLHPMQDLSKVNIENQSNICFLTGEDVKSLSIDNYRLMRDVDALISDYSSAAFDFLMINRPIGYVFSDLKFYKQGLSVNNVDDYIAGPIINTFESLLKFINEVSIERDEYKLKRNNLREKLFEYNDAESCKRIAEFIGL